MHILESLLLPSWIQIFCQRQLLIFLPAWRLPLCMHLAFWWMKWKGSCFLRILFCCFGGSTTSFPICNYVNLYHLQWSGRYTRLAIASTLYPDHSHYFLGFMHIMESLVPAWMQIFSSTNYSILCRRSGRRCVCVCFLMGEMKRVLFFAALRPTLLMVQWGTNAWHLAQNWQIHCWSLLVTAVWRLWCSKSNFCSQLFRKH